MNKQFWGVTIGLVSVLAGLSPVILAKENKSSISYFSRSPRLINVMTTYRGARVRRPRYYYTIDLPNGSGNPLKTITINQRQGSEEIDYYPQDTIAFQGTPAHRENPLTIAETTWDKTTETMMITFDPPVSPGTTFTIGLKAKKNPEYGGIYLFGVTAFPAGNNPRPGYLGSGRLHFDGTDDGDFD